MLLLCFFARRQIQFIEDDLRVSQTLNIDCQKRVPVILDVFHLSRGRRLSRLSMERDLGIFACGLETYDNLPL